MNFIDKKYESLKIHYNKYTKESENNFKDEEIER